MSEPRILCISLSPLRRDARVLRQISVLAELGAVTTVGYGEAPEGAREHVRVPDELASLPQTPLGVMNLALRRLRASELTSPAARFALGALEGRRWDLVVANDARVLALAHRLAAGAPVWADMHEWAPEERTHVLAWRLLVAPLMRHLCARYLPSSAAVTTVCESIAELYARDFGVRPEVVRNAGPWQPLAPTAVTADRVRLVHSGAAIHGRRLDIMIDAVRSLDERFTLDLYLVPAGDGGAHQRELERRAGGDPRIRFLPPVPPARLPEVLNAYDVGVFWIPPTHTNARYTLPNKFFDYVQARLAIAVGPTIEMERLVHRHGLGVVSSDFTVEACASSLRVLDAEGLVRCKQASDAASHDLSFEADAAVIRRVLEPLLVATPGPPADGARP